MSLQVWLPFNGSIENQGLTQLPSPSYTNSITYPAAGKIGSCMNGILGYHLTNEIVNNQWSVAVWILSTASFGVNNNVIFCKNGSSSADCHIYFSIINGTYLSLGVNGPAQSISKTYTFELNTWYHVAATYDGNTAKLFINGEQIHSGTVTTSQPSGRLNMFINGRSANASGTSVTGHLWGYRFNDFRLYDHALSAKEVSEIAKGLMIHYKLDDGYTETTTNILPSPYKSSYTAASFAWDTSKHPDAITVNVWSSGYNSGVSEPSSGYHAMWQLIDDIPTVVFNNLNSEIGKTGRWLGVSVTMNTIISAGTKYTVSFELKANTTTQKIQIAPYFKLNSSASNSFNDGSPLVNVSRTNQWEKKSYTFTRNSSFDGNVSTWQLYLYGNQGTEGTAWVRNVQLEVKDHATPYVGLKNSARSTPSQVYDVSGYRYDGTPNNIVINTDAARYSGGAVFNGSSSYIKVPTNAWMVNGATEMTVSIWAKATAWSSWNSRLYSCTEGGGFNCEWYSTGSTLSFTQNVYTNAAQSTHGYPTQTSRPQILRSDLTEGWHLFTYTYTTSTAKIYLDGVLYQECPYTSYGLYFNKNINLFLGCEAGSSNNASSPWYSGQLSDFRLYATALSAAAIKELYETSASIDKNGNVYAREVIE